MITKWEIKTAIDSDKDFKFISDPVEFIQLKQSNKGGRPKRIARFINKKYKDVI